MTHNTKRTGSYRTTSVLLFIIKDDLKMFYYSSLSEWNNERGYLRVTCLTAQDRFRKVLEYFKIPE